MRFTGRMPSMNKSFTARNKVTPLVQLWRPVIGSSRSLNVSTISGINEELMAYWGMGRTLPVCVAWVDIWKGRKVEFEEEMVRIRRRNLEFNWGKKTLKRDGWIRRIYLRKKERKKKIDTWFSTQKYVPKYTNMKMNTTKLTSVLNASIGLFKRKRIEKIRWNRIITWNWV